MAGAGIRSPRWHRTLATPEWRAFFPILSDLLPRCGFPRELWHRLTGGTMVRIRHPHRDHQHPGERDLPSRKCRAFAGSHHLFLYGMLRATRRNRNSRKQPDTDIKSTEETASKEGATMASLEALDHDRQALLSLLKEGLDAHGRSAEIRLED